MDVAERHQNFAPFAIEVEVKAVPGPAEVVKRADIRRPMLSDAYMGHAQTLVAYVRRLGADAYKLMV